MLINFGSLMRGKIDKLIKKQKFKGCIKNMDKMQGFNCINPCFLLFKEISEFGYIKIKLSTKLSTLEL